MDYGWLNWVAWLFRYDGNLAMRFFTDTLSFYRGVVAQLNVDQPALVGWHRLQYLAAPGFERLVSDSPGKLAKLLLTALAIAFNVEKDEHRVPHLFSDDQAGYILQGIQGFSMPPDQDAQIRTPYVNHDWDSCTAVNIFAKRCLYLGIYTHFLQKLLDSLGGYF